MQRLLSGQTRRPQVPASMGRSTPGHNSLRLMSARVWRISSRLAMRRRTLRSQARCSGRSSSMRGEWPCRAGRSGPSAQGVPSRGGLPRPAWRGARKREAWRKGRKAGRGLARLRRSRVPLRSFLFHCRPPASLSRGCSFPRRLGEARRGFARRVVGQGSVAHGGWRRTPAADADIRVPAPPSRRYDMPKTTGGRQGSYCGTGVCARMSLSPPVLVNHGFWRDAASCAPRNGPLASLESHGA